MGAEAPHGDALVIHASACQAVGWIEIAGQRAGHTVLVGPDQAVICAARLRSVPLSVKFPEVFGGQRNHSSGLST